jgi:hypothetical protein
MSHFWKYQPFIYKFAILYTIIQTYVHNSTACIFVVDTKSRKRITNHYMSMSDAIKQFFSNPLQRTDLSVMMVGGTTVVLVL